MGEKILIVTDNTGGRWISRIAKEKRHSSFEAYILTLGITPEYFRFNCGQLDKIADCKFVDVKDISEEAQRRIGEFYINFIFELPARTRKGLFFHDGKNLWWFLKVSEKNTVGSRIIDRLFYIELTRLLSEKEEFKKIYLDLNDYSVSRAISTQKQLAAQGIYNNIFNRCKISLAESFSWFAYDYLRHSFGTFLMAVIRSAALKTTGLKGAKLPKEKKLFFYTHYPFWWNDPYSDGARENFLGSLPKFIERDHEVFYAASTLPLKPLIIFFKRFFLKKFFEKNNMVLVEELLRLREKLKILSPGYFYWALSVRRYFKKISKLTYKGFDITGLFYHEICRSLSGAELFNDILIENAFENFAKRYSPRALVYRIEFQPFEKALLRGLGGRCKTIAFQHSTFSRNRISQFFAPKEAAFHLDKNNAKEAMPMPDIIFTAGRYFRDILVNEGFPEERVDICGPIRYHGLVSYLKERKDRTETRRRLGFSDSEKIFLVALNWLEKEGTLLAALAKAGEDLDKTLHIIFRSRPYMKYDKIVSASLRHMRANFKYSFLNAEFPLYDAILISDGVIQVLNTVGYESMAIGKVPIVYENTHAFNINSPEELKGCVPIAYSSGELRANMRSVLESDAGLVPMKRRWPDVLGKFFYDLKNDPNERFVGLLKKHGALS